MGRWGLQGRSGGQAGSVGRVGRIEARGDLWEVLGEQTGSMRGLFVLRGFGRI